MSKRRASEPLTKVTLNLFAKDYDRMQDLYPQVGATVAIREIVRQHVRKVESHIEALVEPLEIDIDVITE